MAQMLEEIKHLDPSSVDFCVLLPNEVRALSVVKICAPVSFNTLGHPIPGGLYDPAMGPMRQYDICTTCAKPATHCRGHFGHIELPLPVFNPLFYKTIYTILRYACLSCYKLLITDNIRNVLITQLRLLDAGFIIEAQELQTRLKIVGDEKVPELLEQIQFTKEDMEKYVMHITQGLKKSEMIAKETKTIEALRNLYLQTVLSQLKAPERCDCEQLIPRITLVHRKLMTVVPGSKSSKGKIVGKSHTTIITPEEARNHMRKLWKNGPDFIIALAPVLENCNIEYPTDIFFVEVVPVPPPQTRPVNFVHNKIVMHPQSSVYEVILEHCIIMRNVILVMKEGNEDKLSNEGRRFYQHMDGKNATEKLHFTWKNLQESVDLLIDAGSSTKESRHGNKYEGLKQLISKKEGLIRMHMMGKRVNFAGRTVITPDPNLNVDEIGIPEAFAKCLTFPTPVTPWNVSALRTSVINGPDVLPGATSIIMENGRRIKISSHELDQRESLAKRLLTPEEDIISSPLTKSKVVHRHLQTGDILLMNRQPTLHKPSIMGHRARVLRGIKTFRMHYANCKAYNADFDGDEMNAHFPQNEVARAEAYFVTEVGQQYVVPKDGTPLAGLIQDHVIAGVRLTVRGQFFNHQDYCGLIMHALPSLANKPRLLPPAMIRPARLWSGKQLLSTIILNIIPAGKKALSLIDGAKIGAKAWSTSKPRKWRAGGTQFQSTNMSESEVIIRHGELLCGVLDKKHFGSTPYGLAHCIYELYGGSACTKFLSALGRLFTAYLQIDGFTLGVHDILVVPTADEEREKAISKVREVGPLALASALDLPLNASSEQQEKELHQQLERIVAGDQRLRAAVDHAYKKVLDPYTDKISQACIPNGLVSTFPSNNLQLMVQSGAKGSTVNTLQISCLLGQIELEGRRPPLMPSGKSLPSFRRFDPTPRAGGFIDGRFMTGIQPQEFFFHCMAGREGLIDTAVKTSRSGYLQRCLVKHLEGLVVGYDMTVRDSDGSIMQFWYGEDGLDVTKSQFLTKKQLPFLANNWETIYDEDAVNLLNNDEQYEKVRKFKKKYKRWLQHQDNKIISAKKKAHPAPDPLMSNVNPSDLFGILNENLDAIVDGYLSSNNENPYIRDTVCLKTMQALCNPGEPVGVLAAQSIGEPSTQMTLNTFHFAGRGEMNVTLGIPRLREILMMASKNIKTPTMEIPFVRGSAKEMSDVQRKLQRTVLADVLEYVKVKDWLNVDPKDRFRKYCIHLQMLPASAYKNKHYADSKKILRCIEKDFFRMLFANLKRKVGKRKKLFNVDNDAQMANEDDVDNDADEPNECVNEIQKYDNKICIEKEEEEEEEEMEDDATAARNRERHCEDHEYSADEEENDEMGEEEEEEGKEEKSVIPEIYDQKENSTGQLQNKDDAENTLKWDTQKQINMQEVIYHCKEVIDKYQLVVDYEYDFKNYLWCKVTIGLPLIFQRFDFTALIKETANNTVVHQTPNINRAFTYTLPNTQNVMLKTDGINIMEMTKFSNLLDVNKLYSNDVYAISQIYGIEAARSVLVKEVKDVFKVYGITVDPRHLLLVADYMTFSGSYEPLNRKGMEANPSPLLQMSFEASLGFVQTAALRGRSDALCTPSSRIMLGRPCNSGTGIFSLRHNLAA